MQVHYYCFVKRHTMTKFDHCYNNMPITVSILMYAKVKAYEKMNK